MTATPATSSRLPNCLIIGAAKAGTTTLFNTLAGHPQVFASPVKETGFFSNDERFGRGLAWYGDEYFGRARTETVRMEASPAYLTWSEKVAGRIRQSYGTAPVTFVAILRDPVTRAYSHYCHRVRLGHESLSFADAIAQEERRLRDDWDALSRAGNGKFGYVRAGCYATRLQPFLERFDRSRFVFLLQEDLRAHRFPDAIRPLLGRLGLDASVPLRPLRLNAPTRARHRTLVRGYWGLKRTFLRAPYTALVPRPVRQRILGVLFPAASNPPMDARIEQRLRERFAAEVKRCQDLIQRDLSHWLPA